MKKLIVNPPNTEGVKMLDVRTLMEAAVSKSLKTDVNDFKPTVVTDGHLKLFIANVGYRVVPISNYTGKELNTKDEALNYFANFARFAYRNLDTNVLNDYWMINLIKSEVDSDRSENSTYGVNTSDPEIISRIPKELNLIANVEVHEPVEANQATGKKLKQTKN